MEKNTKTYKVVNSKNGKLLAMFSTEEAAKKVVIKLNKLKEGLTFEVKVK